MTSNEALTMAVVFVGSFIIIPAIAVANGEWATFGLSILLGSALIVVVSRCNDL